jgi:hypothetical protein
MMRTIAAILVLLLAGCAASAQTRPASVDVNALLPQHPLYGTLAQYDRQIAALRGTLRTQFANADLQIDHSISLIRHDLDRTASATTHAPSPPANHVMLSLSKHNQAPNAPNIASHIRQNYETQHAQLQTTAQRDMAHYRATLLAQQQHAYQTFVESVDHRTQQAYDARAQELREKESTLLLNLAHKDAPQRLQLRAKLQTLTLDAATRSRMQQRLRAIQAREDAAVAALRRKDAGTLDAYAAQLRRKSDADIAKMSAELQTRTNANIAARERVLAAQTSGSDALAIPSAPAQAASGAEMQGQYNALMNAPPFDTAAFSNARDDLTRRFTDLRKSHDDDTQHTQSQIAWLEHDRDAVRKRMIAQIMFEAGRLAKSRGYSNVYPASQAPPGSADLTSAVLADLKSLSP